MPSKCNQVRAPGSPASLNSVRYHHGTANRCPDTFWRLVPTYRFGYWRSVTRPASTVEGNVIGNHPFVEKPRVEMAAAPAVTSADDCIHQPASSEVLEGITGTPGSASVAPGATNAAIVEPTMASVATIAATPMYRRLTFAPLSYDEIVNKVSLFDRAPYPVWGEQHNESPGAAR